MDRYFDYWRSINPVDEDEIKALQESARTLKEVVDTIDFN